MAEKDYYKILGVDKSVKDEELKKSYRKLAMKYHPDRTKGDKAAEEKFKEINEAYAVLSDKEKRQQYDTFGANGFQQRYSQEDIFKGFDFSNIFDFAFGGGQGKRSNVRYSFDDMSSQFFGNQQRQQSTKAFKGSDVVYEIQLTLKEIASGITKTILLQYNGQTEKVEVKIPKGLIHGKKLRLIGKGEKSPFGGPAGDLYIQSNLINNSIYGVEGHDLYVDREIKLSEAILGTIIDVPTLDDKELSLKIPAGTNHKTKLRLQGHGLPQMNSEKRGDIFVKINVNIPKSLDSDQKNAVEKIAEFGL